MQIKPLGKVIILILVVAVIFGGIKLWSKIAPSAETTASLDPGKIVLPQRQIDGSGGTVAYVAPGTGTANTDKPEVRLLGYAWNAQMGMLLANGGAQTTQNSLMAKQGVNFKFQRQDDNNKLQEALVSFATELSQGNPNPSKGAHFMTMMGDGSAAFLAPLNDTLRKLGPEYQAKIIDAIGYSHGEDKLMGPAEWKSNPAASRGGVIAGVLRDGDWNIAQKWIGDNGLRTNPDEKTWDPDAVNWVNASDYIDACQKYIAGYSETRPVVRNGKRTGETKTITVNGVVTWTPGDVIVAQKKGGLASIVSTKEYSSQMPCVLIGIDKWCKDNRRTVDNILFAIAQGGDMVKSSPEALHHAAEISNDIYNEPNTDAAYWEKYFKGTEEQDKTGMTVELGGSSVNNLAESLLAFGLLPGSANAVGATYTVFGDIVKAQYPNLVPSFQPADQIIDTSYLQDIAKQAAPSAKVIDQVKRTWKRSTGGAGRIVSRRQWNIHFDPGKATFSPDAAKLLGQLSRDLIVAGGTSVEVHGHTDNQGDPHKSKPLSEARAFAVKAWLQHHAPVNFPDERIQVFAHGEDNPLVPNTSDANRAKNRRVEIILRQAS